MTDNIGKMTVGAAAYEYVAANALRSTPDMVTSFSAFDENDQSTLISPAVNTALLYGPKVLGDTGEAFWDIGESAFHLTEDTGLKENKNNE